MPMLRLIAFGAPLLTLSLIFAGIASYGLAYTLHYGLADDLFLPILGAVATLAALGLLYPVCTLYHAYATVRAHQRKRRVLNAGHSPYDIIVPYTPYASFAPPISYDR